MEFPDQSHFNRIRNSLWKQSATATVMVGSGFSRNAEKSQSTALPAPTWRDLSEAMCQELYPQDEDKHRRAALVSSAETRGALRLAQEYEVAFGRDGLHRFLRSQVKDGQLKPGNTHRRFLQLPWRDVFTTNWDTLLERASKSVSERRYSVLYNTDEIPLTASPRIVKLHGSVDGHFPLVFTEEDYRTYPSRFAPFVNTVQQAMMESIFCLLGFSGDDPNFLHWLGWVRDNLGASAPKVYLVGWLGLSNHRRRMLEDRNIVPIDLARHPKADQWPRKHRHELATEWVLLSLELGRPYEVADWPSPSDHQHPPILSYLKPIQLSTRHDPKPEPTIPREIDQSSDKKLAFVRKLIEVWTYNRLETYPGWLVAPIEVRRKMWSTREKAKYILEVIRELPPVESLLVIYELVWRWEIQLEPISILEPTSTEIEQAAAKALARINCESRKVDDDNIPNIDWPIVCTAWFAVSFALVAAARNRWDEMEFNKRISSLLPFEQENADVAHRICYERCLWAIYSFDYASLANLIKNWNVESADPVWMMRQAALLFEMDENKKAHELNSKALEQSRKGSREEVDIGSLSREAWSLCCAGTNMEHEKLWNASKEWWQRWEQLTPFKCNSPQELQSYTEQIKGEVSYEKARPFDVEDVWAETISFSQGEFLRWAAAHRAVRLAELVGLPPKAGNIKVASDILELSARRLIHYEPELAMRLVIRAAQTETSDTLNYVLSRTQIARITSESAKRLAQYCLKAIDYILSRIRFVQSFHQRSNRLAVFMEALSRFVLRLAPEKANAIFDSSMEWYTSNIVSKSVSLANPMGHLLSRTWEALSVESQQQKILDLLSAPIVDFDGFLAGHCFLNRYPDPSHVLKRDTNFEIKRTAESDQRWREIVRLVIRALRSGGEPRKRAANRLYWLVEFKILIEDETAELGKTLWGDDYEEHCDLPQETGMNDWEFMLLPEIRPGLAEERFRLKWLKNELLKEHNLWQSGKVIWNVGSAIRSSKINGFQFRLSNKERYYLVNVVMRWAKEPIPVSSTSVRNLHPIFLGDADLDVRFAIQGLQYILLEIEISENIGKDMFKKWKKLIQSGFQAQKLSIGLAKILPDQLEEIVKVLRMGLASDNFKRAKDAVNALEFWLQTEKITSPPDVLIQEVGVIIATRRKAALAEALQVAKKIMANGSLEQRNAIYSLAVHGLGYLAEELNYENVDEELLDVPLLRYRCTKLAIEMSKNRDSIEPIIANWIANSHNDPLPEIRSISA